MENIIENYKSQMKMVNTQMLQGLRLIEDLTIFYKALNNLYKFSEYNGVQWSKKMNIWIAFLDFGTSKIPIGGYTTEEDAYNGRNSYIEATFGKKMEIWKPIPNSHFSISNKGRMKNNMKNIILQPRISRDEYLCYSYKTNAKYKDSTAHRLVYQLFGGDIPRTYIIKHIDSDKMNNTIENLECVSPSENIKRLIIVKGIPIKYNCSCGGKYTQDYKTFHIGTKKHQDYLYRNT